MFLFRCGYRPCDSIQLAVPKVQKSDNLTSIHRKPYVPQTIEYKALILHVDACLG